MRPMIRFASAVMILTGMLAPAARAQDAAQPADQTKPAPDLVRSALDKAGAEPADAVMIGDTTWDIEAARNAGLSTLAVMTGGFSEAELTDAGALAVFDSIEALRAGLSDTPLG